MAASVSCILGFISLFNLFLIFILFSAFSIVLLFDADLQYFSSLNAVKNHSLL